MARIEDNGAAGVVVDDCRYLNEAEWLRKHGFIIVKVVGRKLTLPDALASHQSEQEGDQIVPDLTVSSTGPLQKRLEELDAAIKAIVQKQAVKQEYMTMRKELLGW